MASFEQLKAKYQSVIDLAKARGVHLKNVHVENEKLLIRGDAPNQDVKNEVWTEIKRVDSGYADLTADLGIDPSLPAPAAAAPGTSAGGGWGAPGSGVAASDAPASGGRIYEVAPGDNLSKIARQVYGDARHFMRIFEANRDQLSDPDRVRVGQKLRIPD